LNKVKKAGKWRDYPMSEANSEGKIIFTTAFGVIGGQGGLMGARILYIQRKSRCLLPVCDIIVQTTEKEALN